MLPGFLVIGAQKSATSSLCELLGQHPDVFMCEPKEPYFFSHDEVFARGMAWYESLFQGAEHRAAVGEGSTTYTQHGLYPEAPARIAEALPDARLVYMVRHPVERVASHWMHLRTKGGRETAPIDEAVRARPEYLDHSLYHHQLSFYRERFPADRLLVLFFDEFKQDAEEVTRECLRFLDVDPARWEPEDASRPRHRSVEGRADTGALRPLRRIPGFAALRDLAPGGVRETLRRALKKPVGVTPELADGTRRWLEDRLRDDAHAFLESCGKPVDYWGF